MKPRVLLPVLVATMILGGVTATSVTAATSSGPACVPLVARATHGAAAITALGTRLPEAAARNHMAADRLRALLATDSTLWLDVCGQAYYVDAGATGTAGAAVSPAAPFPYSQTFLLHSKPGSSRTIYLNFVGTTISSSYGGGWLTYLGSGTFNVPGYDTDGNYGSFSNGEQDIIQDVWRRVAEDYAPFDVDVTTEAPAASALQRTDASDTVYGTTAAISSDTSASSPFAKICSSNCGGVAFVGVFNQTGTTHEYYQPAWVFTGGLAGGLYAKYIAEATSHEVGHNLGLSHDGTSSAGYYTGSSGWAPIMGASYYEPITQWSRGMYPGANNQEDDYAVMATYGAAVRADEDSDSAATARAVTAASPVSGVIASPSDADWISFTPDTSGAYQFTVTPAPSSPNADIKLDVYSPTVTLLASSNPTMVKSNYDVATGLSASAAVAMTAGQTYYARVDGVGQGTWATYGYDDYGSLGQYTVSVASSAQLVVNAGSLPSATVGRAYSSTLVSAAGGVAPYSFAATGLPAGLAMSPTTGAISGTPTAACSCTVNVTVTDGSSATATSSTALYVAAAPAITTATLPNATYGVAYNQGLTVVGGVSPYAWTATGLPTGLTIGASSGTISGTPSAEGTFTVNVTVTEANGATASATLSLTVVVPTLSITTGSLPNGTVGTPYSQTVSATGGIAPYTWSSTTLPAGLVLNTSTGAITGTPTTAVTSSSVTFSVRDSRTVPVTVSKALTITIVVPPLTITTTSLPNGSRTKSYSATLNASGGSGSRTWTQSGGTWPAGLTLTSSSTSASITGKPTTRGTYTFTIQVSDASGSIPKQFTIKVT